MPCTLAWSGLLVLIWLTLQELVAEVQKTAPVKAPQQVGEDLTLKSLELDQLELLKKQMNYDEQAYRIYKEKCQSMEAAQFHSRLEWRRQCWEVARSAVTQWWSRNICLVAYKDSPL